MSYKDIEVSSVNSSRKQKAKENMKRNMSEASMVINLVIIFGSVCTGKEFMMTDG